jgi:hypothetical protein
MGMIRTSARFFWDPVAKKLSVDDKWMIRSLAEGQNAMSMPSMVGDWVAIQTNGQFSDKKASSVVVINQDDASRVHTIFPYAASLSPASRASCRRRTVPTRRTT